MPGNVTILSLQIQVPKLLQRGRMSDWKGSAFYRATWDNNRVRRRFHDGVIAGVRSTSSERISGAFAAWMELEEKERSVAGLDEMDLLNRQYSNVLWVMGYAVGVCHKGEYLNHWKRKYTAECEQRSIA